MTPRLRNKLIISKTLNLEQDSQFWSHWMNLGFFFWLAPLWEAFAFLLINWWHCLPHSSCDWALSFFWFSRVPQEQVEKGQPLQSSLNGQDILDKYWSHPLKQACCAGCRSRSFPMKLHQWAKSTHSAKLT